MPSTPRGISVHFNIVDLLLLSFSGLLSIDSACSTVCNADSLLDLEMLKMHMYV